MNIEYRNNEYGNTPVLILSGGFGTRLSTILEDKPKILAPFGQRTFLDILIKQLETLSLNNIIFCLGHGSEQIINYIKNRNYKINIQFSIEEKPLGTGGAIRKACEIVDSDYFFAVNGDTYLNIDSFQFYTQTLDAKANLGISVTPVKDVSRYGAIKTSNEGYVEHFLEKGESGNGIINAGWYLMKKQLFEPYQLNMPFSLEKDFLMNQPKQTIKAYQVNKNFLDYGTPESYEQAQLMFNNLYEEQL